MTDQQYGQSGPPTAAYPPPPGPPYGTSMPPPYTPPQAPHAMPLPSPPPQAPPPPPVVRVGWRQLSGALRAFLIVLAVFAVGGSAAGALGLQQVTQAKHQARTEAHQLQVVSKANSELAQQEAGDNGHIGEQAVDLNTLKNDFALLAPFTTTTCTGDENGANGQPQQFFYPCTSTKP